LNALESDSVIHDVRTTGKICQYRGSSSWDGVCLNQKDCGSCSLKYCSSRRGSASEARQGKEKKRKAKVKVNDADDADDAG
jgi:hypothetical protein